MSSQVDLEVDASAVRIDLCAKHKFWSVLIGDRPPRTGCLACSGYDLVQAQNLPSA